MIRHCPVPKYGEEEVRQATDNLGSAHRALGTPYGILVYLSQLRGSEVVIRPVHLGKVADVEAFWSEATAGRALSAPPRNPHILPYLGCCPALACHVYEQRPYTCSLRAALGSASPHRGALGGWEARMAVCQQVVSAGAHLVRSGVNASDLSASHILIQLDGSAAGPLCWLGPGCGFRAAAASCTAAPSPPQRQRPPSPTADSRQGQYPSQGQGQASAGDAGDEARRQLASLARSLGQVLMQVVGGVDAPVPPPNAVLQSLADMTPSRLVSAAVAPPLTDEQTWPLLAAVYPLLVWGDATAGHAGGRQAAAAAATRTTGRGGQGPAWPPPPVAAAASQRANPWSLWGAPADRSRPSGNRVGDRSRTGDGRSEAEGSEAVALQGHLLREVAPVLSELQRQLQLQGAVPAARPRQQQPSPPPPTEGRSSPSAGAADARDEASEEHDAFAGASAPPLSMYPPVPQPHAGPPNFCVDVPEAAAPPWSGQHSAPTPAGPAVPAARPAAGPPAELLCPITHELMEDPVVAPDGHSYERAAVARWFAGRPGRPTSPLTGAVLPHTGLTPNYALRKIIADWRAAHGE